MKSYKEIKCIDLGNPLWSAAGKTEDNIAWTVKVLYCEGAPYLQAVVAGKMWMRSLSASKKRFSTVATRFIRGLVKDYRASLPSVEREHPIIRAGRTP